MLSRYASYFEDTVINQAELRVDFPNGGQIRLYGADNPDSLRGIYLDGVVFDEYAQMRDRECGMRWCALRLQTVRAGPSSLALPMAVIISMISTNRRRLTRLACGAVYRGGYGCHSRG